MSAISTARLSSATGRWKSWEDCDKRAPAISSDRKVFHLDSPPFCRQAWQTNPWPPLKSSARPSRGTTVPQIENARPHALLAAIEGGSTMKLFSVAVLATLLVLAGFAPAQTMKSAHGRVFTP